MLVAISKVQIAGRKPHVEPILGSLYEIRLLDWLAPSRTPALQLAPFPDEDERDGAAMSCAWW